MNPPVILFPQEPFCDGEVDSAFVDEFDAARSIGFPTELFAHELIEGGNASESLSKLSLANAQRLILRGWMLPGESYAALYEALQAKGYEPQTSPEDYEQAHYLPYGYPLIKEHTSRSEWIEGDDPNAAWEMYQRFRHADAIIKDWVKSAKSRWKEGCYIPANTTEDRFKEIYKVFRQERSKLFNRGVVLREFMPIVERGSDIRGLPIVEEWRLFFWRGKILIRPDQKHPSPLGESDRWEAIAQQFSSPFITIDVAYLTDDTWKIVEVGDGGVSGLPIGLDPVRFYSALWNQVAEPDEL
ncbi:MAG: ATP-grasp domain-containing protein [Verrucomicrobiota bacterium]